MNQKEKAKFRTSKAWKELRHQINVNQNGRDPITKSKLVKRFNLHHLDLRAENYNCIYDETRFVGLNPKTHDAVHLLFNVYKKDPAVIERLKELFELMKKFSHDEIPTNAEEIEEC